MFVAVRWAAGEWAVVIGGGPIGLLIALVARAHGVQVLIVEPDETRRLLAEELGFTAFDPSSDDVDSAVAAATDGVGAEVVFEVSGSESGILAATRYAALRGCVVVVAIYPSPNRSRCSTSSGKSSSCAVPASTNHRISMRQSNCWPPVPSRSSG